MTLPKSSWWRQIIWQGINGHAEAWRAQTRCEEKPCQWEGGAALGQVSHSGGALSALWGVQNWARQNHGRADLVLSALLLWAGGWSGWPPEVPSNQHPCDFLPLTLRKPISSYAALPSKSGAQPWSPVPNPDALLTLWTAGRWLQQVLPKHLCDMGVHCYCTQLTGHLEIAPNISISFHLEHCPVTPGFKPLLCSIPVRGLKLNFPCVMRVCFNGWAVVFSGEKSETNSP